MSFEIAVMLQQVFCGFLFMVRSISSFTFIVYETINSEYPYYFMLILNSDEQAVKKI